MNLNILSDFMFMKDTFVELAKLRALKNKETCPHWIDYEIYESLPEGLAEKYLEQFDFPTICISKGSGESSFSTKILCKPRDRDPPQVCSIDCSACYPVTLNTLFQDFGNVD